MKNEFVYQKIDELKLTTPFFDINYPELYAQCGEDYIIECLLRAYATTNQLEMHSLTYLEIGANHPIATSATYLLHKKYGMNGVLVDANPALIDELKKVRIHDRILNIAITDQSVNEVTLHIPQANELATINDTFLDAWPGDGANDVTTVNVKACKINDLLKTEFPKQVPVYISIDIEGVDLQVIKTMDFEIYRPYIISIEPSDHFIHDTNTQMIKLLTEKRYSLIARTDVNLIFIDKSA